MFAKKPALALQSSISSVALAKASPPHNKGATEDQMSADFKSPAPPDDELTLHVPPSMQQQELKLIDIHTYIYNIIYIYKQSVELHCAIWGPSDLLRKWQDLAVEVHQVLNCHKARAR